MSMLLGVQLYVVRYTTLLRSLLLLGNAIIAHTKHTRAWAF